MIPKWKQAFEKRAAWDNRTEVYAQIYDPESDSVKDTVAYVRFSSDWNPTTTKKEAKELKKFLVDLERAIKAGHDVIIRTNS